MIKRLYRKFIGRFIFRKLNLGIGIALMMVFIMIGLLTYSTYYNLLEQREREVLRFRTERAAAFFEATAERFKDEIVSMYAGQAGERGAYEYFLPGNIPAAADQRAVVTEAQYFDAQLSLMLNRNPNAALFYLYRVEDGKVFFKARNGSIRIRSSFNADRFFAMIPKDYDFPYIGKLESFADPHRELIYLINPIFSFHRIHHHKPYGYVMMGVDARTVYRAFQADGDSRLVVWTEKTELMDSHPEAGEAFGGGGALIETFSLPKYGITFIGAMDKRSILAKLSKTTAMIVLILTAFWTLCVLIIHFIQRFVVRRIKILSQQFKKVQTNPFTPPLADAGEDEIGDLIDKFNRMTLQLQEHIQQVYLANLQKRNAEYLALKMQINPHFLYNTLESLRMQALLAGQRQLGEKLFMLGKLFRWMLRSGDDLVPIEEELRYAGYYLELYMLGKSRRIKLHADSELDLGSCRMLKFSLQPIIENAIRHGQLENVDQPQITVRVLAQDGCLLVDVANNGQGVPLKKREELNLRLQAETFADEHLGLKNVHDRIRNFFGPPYGLTVLPIPPEEGFGVRMKLPLKVWDKKGGSA